MPHRTLAEWEKLQAEMREEANQRPPLPEGELEVQVKYPEGRVEYVRAPKVATLEDAGYKVIIRHRRYPAFKVRKEHRLRDLWLGEPRITTKGGMTHVLLLAPEHGAWAEGRSVCMAQDAYSKKVGYALAVNLALAQLNGRIA